MVQNGRLNKLKVGSAESTEIARTGGFTLFAGAGAQYLIYKSDSSKQTVIINLNTENNLSFANVEEYKISPTGNSLILKVAETPNLNTLTSLNLSTGVYRDIYSGSAVSHLIFSKSGADIAFTTDTGKLLTLWLYDHTMTTASPILQPRHMPNDKVISVDDIWEFSDDSRMLYFTFLPDVNYIKKPTDPDIWSYQDQILYSQYKMNAFKGPREWRNLTTLDINSGKVTQLLFGNEHKGSVLHKISGDKFVIEVIDTSLISKRAADKPYKSYYMVNGSTGQRTLLRSSSITSIYDIKFSPDNRFITYRDGQDDVYKCFDVPLNAIYDFTQEINKQMLHYDGRTRSTLPNYKGVIGWIKGTTHVLMVGMHGIWELDVTGKCSPRNLTANGKNDGLIHYSFCEKMDNQVIDPSKDLYVYGVNHKTKESSLYRLNIKRKIFQELYAGNFFWAEPYGEVPKRYFQRAKNADAFIVAFPTVDKTPDLFFTTQFRKFDTLTTLYPEKKYNWLTSELHTYKDELGNVCQGLLYKPENFNPDKKYPIILYFYQNISNTLNEPLSVDPVSSGLNIPHLVSNGYLVFQPDIYIEKGKFGQYVLMSINAAADHLSTFNYIDSNKMAIAGHSYGGYEVNQIITHTNRFSAALSGAGFSSIVNNTFDLGVVNEEVRSFSRINSRMTVDFEDAPQLYIDNSPIFKTKNIQTPVLFLHSEDDRNVPFYHSLQMFLSLRHQGKKAWLLSYKDGGHGVGSLENRIDYMKKTKEFFDYYLKNEPIPGWMQRHIKY
ncbi:S9 family peptidase [Chitinophaga agri]|uniref:S9 family peptidase n=1 Tax=Chitinophaga agri TaxID=2703787 RepID=A0A6B9Z7W6_9BACT|nr:prolyl oligopeptidase family serine peptidase [Chitinophaga agri]QHS58332.1 S9 family peptidase [Chitinophaga agri]